MMIGCLEGYLGISLNGLVLFTWKVRVEGGGFEEVPMGMGAYVYDERGILSF
jgi:hypothetical protein